MDSRNQTNGVSRRFCEDRKNAAYQQLLRRALQEKGRDLLPLSVLVRQLEALKRV